MDMGSGYPSGLTASQIGTLIEMYWNPNVSIDKKDYAAFVELELLYSEAMAKELTGTTTPQLSERGHMFVSHLLNQPLPVKAWAMQP